MGLVPVKYWFGGVEWFILFCFSQEPPLWSESHLSENMSNICQCTWINPCWHPHVFTSERSLLVLASCRAHLIVQTTTRPPRAELCASVSILPDLIPQSAPLSPTVLFLSRKMVFWVIAARPYTRKIFQLSCKIQWVCKRRLPLVQLVQHWEPVQLHCWWNL